MEVWPQRLLDMISSRGAEPLFEQGDRVVSGNEMTSLIRRTAAGLRTAGVKPGDGVVMHLGVAPETFAAIAAAYAVGARVAGVRGDQLRHAITTSGGLVIDDATLPSLLSCGEEPVVASGRPDDIARIVYTSGSTGLPKGCCQTYAAMTAREQSVPSRWSPGTRSFAERMSRFLVFGSLSAQVMFEYSELTIASGGVLVAAEPPIYPEAVAKLRATAGVITVGRLHQLVKAQRTEPADLSSLRGLMVSGSPIEPARLSDALDVLGPVLFNGYGQTEAGLIAMITPDELLASGSRLGTVGRPLPDVEVVVRGGELYVRTPWQSTFYWDDPAETAEVFIDGWVRTRDLAALGPDGYLRLQGRARDVIIVQAELVYAGPIERALATSPAVAEAYVVGRPDEDSGEAVHAFVVPAPGQTPSIPSLRALVEGSLGPKAVPATITLIDAAPVAPSGKPDKTALQVP